MVEIEGSWIKSGLGVVRKKIVRILIMLEMVFIKNILYLCFVFWKVKMSSVDVLIILLINRLWIKKNIF